ncbi:MAG: Plasmid stabilization system protein [Acidobacteria bacterium OLB17]|nr:MAG: Plasmid stabilization system protein [Acidobacteria bacterium OLB17]MCZ2391174.1 type II toxin-antitoxin system RelE/ParE family toxin [Acidobacteriota bacterium]
MKKYRVTITMSAKSDITDSFVWGCREWGVAAAKEWATELRRAIKRRLTHHPLSCPLAPDRDLSEPEVRQLIIGRYRVLFEVVGDRSRVLTVRGSFSGNIDEER